MRYRLGVSGFGRFFNVPCSAVENYIKLADAEFYKVLLCALCSDSPEIDSAELAARCGVAPKKAEDALIYWSSNGVIQLMKSDGSSAAAVQTAAAANTGTAQVCITDAIDPMKNTAAAKVSVRYTPKELAQKAKENAEIAAMFEEVQRVFGRPVNETETAALVNLYEYYSFSAATIIIIAQYCQDVGRSKVASVEKLAKKLFEDGITEYSQVETELGRLMTFSDEENRIAAALYVEMPLTDGQRKYFRRWIDWGFNIDVIKYAGQRCREQKNKFDLRYTDGILRRWQKEGLFTIGAVEESERAYRVKKSAEITASSYDIEKWNEMASEFDPTKLSFEEEPR